MDNKKKLFLIFCVSTRNLGNILFDFFIIWAVTSNSGDVTDAAVMIGSSILFRSVSALFVGSIIDMTKKKKLLYVVNLIPIVLALLLVSDISFLANIEVGIVLVLINDFTNNLFTQSVIIVASNTFKSETYIKYKAVENIVTSTLSIIANFIAGLFMTFTSSGLVLSMIIFSFFLSSLSILKIDYVEIEKSDASSIGINNTLSKLLSEIVVAFKYIVTHSFIRSFLVIMLLLNLAYGFIPKVLPVAIATVSFTPLALSLIKVTMSVGRIVGLLIVSKCGRYVSLLFKIGMIGSALCMLLLIIESATIIFLSFFFYELFDALTQPLFSYTVTLIPSENRAKILAGIDTIILLSPIVGIWIGTILFDYSKVFLYSYLSLIFVIAALVTLKNKTLQHIIAKNGGL